MRPNSPLHLGLLSKTLLLGTTRVSLPNGNSFRPKALKGYMSVIDDTVQRGHITVFNASAGHFLDHLGRRISLNSGEETSYLYQ